MRIIIAMIITLLFIVGCSEAEHPVTPAMVPSETGHTLLGSWSAEFDTDMLQVGVTPDRKTTAHYNVTSMIPTPGIIVNSYDPVSEIVDVDVTISNTYTLNGYDVRLIIYTDSIGHKLTNADDWTGLYDISSGLPINPFKAYAKSEPSRMFAGQTQHTENLLIKLPGSNPNVNFAVDASFPTNCEEPYSIANFSQGYLYEEPGSSTGVTVDVYDWQEDVDSVELYCPNVIGAGLLPFTQIDTITWEAMIVNNTGASAGEYFGYIVASSGTTVLYDEAMITVDEFVDYGWTRTWGGTEGEYQFERGNDVGTDSSGNVYVTGCFRRTCDFDPGLGEDKHTSNGETDIFLSKFDSDGNFLWARTWGGPGGMYEAETGNAVDVYEGYVYVGGCFQGIVDFDPGPGEDFHSGGAFISKFDRDGNYIWVVTWEVNCGFCGVYGLDINEEIMYVTGTFKETVDFDPGPGEDLHTSNGGDDVFLSKFDVNGNFVWTRTWGGVTTDYGWCTNTDNSGNIYVSGYFRETVDFDPGPGEDLHTSYPYSRDAFLSKFDFGGNFQWAQTWGYASTEIGYDIGIDSFDNVYVVSSGVQPLSKFDPDGNLQWGKSGGGYAIAIYNDNIYSTGFYLYLSKFNLDGDLLYQIPRNYDGECWLSGYGITADGSGNIYITGSFNGTVDFDPGPDEDRHGANSNSDIFLTKFV